MDQSSSSRFVPGRYAAIDIGTVTCRLMVADVDAQGSITEVCRDREMCNLGLGVDETHRLAPESIERVGKTVERFKATIESLEATGPIESIPVRAMATSASRDAENADEFASRIARAGVSLQVIPGEREAGLSFVGATSTCACEKAVVLDIGGGSTEIIAGAPGEAPRFARSFNVGCRRVTERFFHNDPPSSENLRDATAWIDAQFVEYLNELSSDGCFEGELIAVAGTATSVISMREQMVVYDKDRVHGSVATRSDVNALLKKLAVMTEDERMHVVGLDPGRAPVIVAGLLVLSRILTLVGADEFTASETDILHGIVLDAASH